MCLYVVVGTENLVCQELGMLFDYLKKKESKFKKLIVDKGQYCANLSFLQS